MFVFLAQIMLALMHLIYFSWNLSLFFFLVWSLMQLKKNISGFYLNGGIKTF